MRSRNCLRLSAGALALGLCVGAPLVAALPPRILTKQPRLLDGVAAATWGPVWFKADRGLPPYSWSSVGTLPPGLTLTAAGRLEGATSTAGVYDFSVRVTDAQAVTAERSYRVRVHAPSVVRTPPLEASRLPFSYVQSAFDVGGDDNPGLCGVTRFRPQSKDEFKAMVRMYLKRFSGGETFLARLETPGDFARVRLFNQAIAEVRAESGADFLAVFSNGRLPDFSFPEDLAGQPNGWRAKSLKSNGSIWVRHAEPPTVEGSIFGLRAAHLDITNDTAVTALMDRLARAYDHEGDPADSVGPLNGFLVLNEAKAAPLYLPFLALGAPTDPDEDDLVPRQPPRAACNAQFNHRPDSPPLLSGGDPCVLYADGDPRFSFFVGPKRALPLYSASARAKFKSYAAARGVSVETLPADRNEFNEQEASVTLPAHVQFVPLSDAAVWNVWTNWVHDTWFGYLERLARTIQFAQAGNARFRGVLHFQFPGWYSFRAPARDEVIPFQFRDENDVLQTVSDRKLTDFAGFSQFNDVTHGTDIEQFVRSPWLQAFLHETTTPMMGAGTSVPGRDGDRLVLTSKRGVFEWNQEGAAARLVTRRNQKFFGLFARYHYFGGPAGEMSADDWKWNWNRIVPLNPPDYVATLPPQFYLSPADMDDDAYRCLLPPYFTGLNGAAWDDRFQALRSVYTRPAAWNPRSLGAVDTFDGREASGWAFDPWSTRTALAIRLMASPNSCYTGPVRLATVFADAGSTLADDTGLRAAIRAAANYAPPPAMTFRWGANLAKVLQEAGALCGPGIYKLQVRVEDGQGDGLTQVLPYQASNTLNVLVQ